MHKTSSIPIRKHRQTVFQTPFYTIHQDILLRNHTEQTYYVLDKNDLAVIIPYSPSGKILLIQVYRYPIDQRSWEFPMGTVDSAETAAAGAARELYEETGYAAEKIELIGRWYIGPGMTNQYTHCFLAHISDEEIEKHNQQIIDTDDIILETQLTTITAMNTRTDIIDGPTLTALFFLNKHLNSSR